MKVISMGSLRLRGLTHESEAQSNMLKYAEKKGNIAPITSIKHSSLTDRCVLVDVTVCRPPIVTEQTKVNDS
jgi:hypothetical protein